MRTVKIYQAAAKDLEPSGELKIVAQYPAFMVAEVSDAELDRINKQFLTEDISQQYRIETGDIRLDTAIPRLATSGAELDHPDYPAGEALPRGPHHYLVQFVGPIKTAWLTKLKRAGGDVVAPYEGFAVVARVGKKDVAAVAGLPEVRWMGHLPYAARLSPQLARPIEGGIPAANPQTPRTRYLPGTFVVQFFRPDLAKAGTAKVQRAGFTILDESSSADTRVVRSRAKDDAELHAGLERLARIHGVQRVSARPIRRPSNDHAAVIMAVSTSMAPAPGLNLSGDGEVIGICDTGLDTGDIANIHPDFSGRILALKSYPISADFSAHINNPGANDGPADLDSGHGTHTSGSIVGDGTASSNLPGTLGPIRGLAHRAKLVMQAVEQKLDWKDPSEQQRYGEYLLAGIPSDLKTLFDFAYAKGVRIHSNSWGGGNPGAYDDQCSQLDRYVWNRPDFCVLFAAGNDGRDGDANGVIDEGSVTAPGTAKNCITVGASENSRPQFTLTYGDGWPQDYPVPPISGDRLADNPNQIAAFSSRGPTLDGRIKPDVVAPGTYILSTRSRMLAPNNFGYGKFGPTSLYMFDSGTSMATPLTAGGVALIREFLRKKQGFGSPSAALLKACAIASAMPVNGGAAPDNHQGFGRIALDAVLAPVSPLKALFQEGAGLRTGDSANQTFAVTTAGHSLKIVLVYSDYPGSSLVNNLNMIVAGPDGAQHVGNGGGPSGFDNKNNVEIVEIANATPGQYNLAIVGSNVPNGPQPFALVAIGAF